MNWKKRYQPEMPDYIQPTTTAGQGSIRMFSTPTGPAYPFDNLVRWRSE